MLRKINNELHSLSLRGYLFPWKNRQPVFVNISGSDDLFLPVFSTLVGLETMMRDLAAYDGVKRIDHPGEFLSSVPRTASNRAIRIIVDLHQTDEGTFGFREIVRYHA